MFLNLVGLRVHLVFFVLSCLGLMMINGQVIAADKGSNDTFEYPELLVTPSASKRLKMEADQEGKRAWSNHIPIQASALVTLTSGVLGIGDKGKENKDNKNSSNDQNDTDKKDGKPSVYYAGIGGVVVGTGWLVTTILLSTSYQPYQTGYKEISKLPDKERKDALLKERLAEEHLEAPATLARRLSWISAVSNFAVNVAIAANAEADATKFAGALGAVMAFSPILFSYHWQTVYNQHEEYKKKIYGPLAEPMLYFNKRVVSARDDEKTEKATLYSGISFTFALN